MKAMTEAVDQLEAALRRALCSCDEYDNLDAAADSIREAQRIAGELRALVSTETAQEWHPIESAPKDTRVLVLGPKGVCVASKRVAADWSMWSSYPGLYPVEPTHWMPLPAPPRASLADDEDDCREAQDNTPSKVWASAPSP